MEVFLFIISYFFNVVKLPSLHQRTHILFLNIISYFFIKVNYLAFERSEHRLAYTAPTQNTLRRACEPVLKMWGGGPYGALETTCCDLPGTSKISIGKANRKSRTDWHMRSPGGPTEGRRLGELANPDISGLECTSKGHMDSTEKLPYVVPIGNSGRHARARPAKTLQEY